MNCGVGCRHGSEPALLWLWLRLVAVAPIGPLAWEPPYAAGSGPRKGKKTKKKKKKRKEKKRQRTITQIREKEKTPEKQLSDQESGSQPPGKNFDC